MLVSRADLLTSLKAEVVLVSRRLFVCTFVRLFVYFYICTFVRLYVCSFVRLYVCLFVRLFVRCWLQSVWVELHFDYNLFSQEFPIINDLQRTSKQNNETTLMKRLKVFLINWDKRYFNGFLSSRFDPIKHWRHQISHCEIKANHPLSI
jgi:hypothetical protein